jgi:hypothetical protein
MSFYTTVTVADRTQGIVAENLATAVRDLREASTKIAAQATQVTTDLDAGNNPRMVYGQTLTDLVRAEGAFNTALSTARLLLDRDAVQAIVSSPKSVFIQVEDGSC